MATREKVTEEPLEFFFGHVWTLDVERLEEGLVEHPTRLAIGPSVELLRVAKQLDALAQDLGAVVQTLVVTGELPLQLLALLGNLRQLGPQAPLRQLRVDS